MDEERRRNNDIDKYVDYKELYFKMMRAAEKAINSLVAAQQVCEEMYVDAMDQWDRENGVPDIPLPRLSDLVWEGREEERDLEDQTMSLDED